MRHAILFLALGATGVSGCATRHGGTGTTTDGSPLVSEVTVEPGLGMRLTVTKPNGWSCQSLLPSGNIAMGAATATSVITCNQPGLHGEAIWVAESVGGRLVVSFSLSNGERGTVSHRVGI
jgi:hypothetical protein